jgi:hypothetical protein
MCRDLEGFYDTLEDPLSVIFNPKTSKFEAPKTDVPTQEEEQSDIEVKLTSGYKEMEVEILIDSLETAPCDDATDKVSKSDITPSVSRMGQIGNKMKNFINWFKKDA